MIEDTIKNIVQKRNNDKKEKEATSTRKGELEILLEFLGYSLDEIHQDIKDKKVTVSNLPKVQQVKGEVEVNGVTGLLMLLKQLLLATKGIKLEVPDTQAIKGEVTVTNPTPPAKDVKIPEYPKQIKTDVTSLPKYVSDKLDSLKKSIDSLEMKPEVKVNVDNKKPEVSIDLSGVKNAVEDVVEAVRAIPKPPEVDIDIKPLITRLKAVEQAVKNQIYPVPNLKSSWQHSLTMQSEDRGKVYEWTTDGGKDVVESITFTAVDGNTYKKTYSYDGLGKVSSESSWVQL